VDAVVNRRSEKRGDSGDVARRVYDARRRSRERGGHRGDMHVDVYVGVTAAAGDDDVDDAALRRRLHRLPQSQAVLTALPRRRRQYHLDNYLAPSPDGRRNVYVGVCLLVCLFVC